MNMVESPDLVVVSKYTRGVVGPSLGLSERSGTADGSDGHTPGSGPD